jgi:hypothetical protein
MAPLPSSIGGADYIYMILNENLFNDVQLRILLKEFGEGQRAMREFRHRLMTLGHNNSLWTNGPTTHPANGPRVNLKIKLSHWEAP